MEHPNGTLSRIESKESVEVEIKDCHDVARIYTFHDVQFAPSYGVVLMSVNSAVARGSSFSFAADASHLLAPDGGSYRSSVASFSSSSASSRGLRCF